jgi:hypothetical protein
VTGITDELVNLLFTADMCIDLITDDDKDGNSGDSDSDGEGKSNKKKFKIFFPWFASQVLYFSLDLFPVLKLSNCPSSVVSQCRHTGL